MGKYNFTNINETPINHGSFYTVFGGKVLDSLELGFKTINVFGRELAPAEIKTSLRAGGDGVWVERKYIGERKLVVESFVYTDDAHSLTNKIMRELWLGEQRLVFSDDPDHHYKAYFAGATIPETRTKTAFIKLNFVCADPYKYGNKLREFTGAIEAVDSLPNVPEEMEITLTQNGASEIPLKITNIVSGQQIVLNTDDSYKIGDVVTIKWGEKREIKLNGSNAMDRLSITGDYELFTMKDGDSLSVSPNGDYLVKFREKYY